jgi:hypothetical protein
MTSESLLTIGEEIECCICNATSYVIYIKNYVEPAICKPCLDQAVESFKIEKQASNLFGSIVPKTDYVSDPDPMKRTPFKTLYIGKKMIPIDLDENGMPNMPVLEIETKEPKLKKPTKKSKYDEELTTTIIKALKKGFTKTSQCKKYGITYPTLRRWMDIHEATK